MSDSWLMPKGADLLGAVRWLSQQHRHDRQAIEEVCALISRWMRSFYRNTAGSDEHNIEEK